MATIERYRWKCQKFSGPGSTNVVGINDSGVVVGYYLGASGRAIVDRGFIFADGVLTTLEPPGASDTFVSGIANDGSIAGFYRIGKTAQVDAFVIKDGLYTTFGKDGFDTRLTAVSKGGDVAGYAQSYTGKFLKALFYHHGILTEIPIRSEPGGRFQPYALNDHGTIVGFCGPQRLIESNGFIFENGKLQCGLGAASPPAIPYGVNDSDVVVGQAATRVLCCRAARRRRSGYQARRRQA